MRCPLRCPAAPVLVALSIRAREGARTAAPLAPALRLVWRWNHRRAGTDQCDSNGNRGSKRSSIQEECLHPSLTEFAFLSSAVLLLPVFDPLHKPRHFRCVHVRRPFEFHPAARLAISSKVGRFVGRSAVLDQRSSEREHRLESLPSLSSMATMHATR